MTSSSAGRWCTRSRRRRRRADRPGLPRPAHLPVGAARAASLAAALDARGVPQGARVAIVSPNSARFLVSYFGVSGYGRVLVPVNYRLIASEVAYIVEHSGADVVLVDPEFEALSSVARHGAARRRGRRGVVPRRPRRCGPPAGGSVGGRHLLDQLHLRHDGQAKGGPAHPPELLAERRELRLAPRRRRPRRAPAHAADVPRQRVGDAVRGHGDGRAPRGPPQGRRRGDPRARRPRGRDPHVRRAGGRRHDPRRRVGPRRRGARGPRCRHGAHRRRRRSAAAPDDRTGRGRAALGVRPDLRAHRDLSPAHHQPRPPRVGRPRAEGPSRPARPRRRPRRRGRGRHRRRRRGARAVEPRVRRATGTSPTRPPRPSRAAGSTPGTAASSTARTPSSRIDERT